MNSGEQAGAAAAKGECRIDKLVRTNHTLLDELARYLAQIVGDASKEHEGGCAQGLSGSQIELERPMLVERSREPRAAEQEFREVRNVFLADAFIIRDVNGFLGRIE